MIIIILIIYIHMQNIHLIFYIYNLRIVKKKLYNRYDNNKFICTEKILTYFNIN